jgi:Cu2+-exporting ATPase
VSVQRLAPGDLVRVPVGQAFPADALLVEGSTRADESLLTGESVPVVKPAGAAVVAGSINLGAPVVVQVQRVGGDTRLEGIVALMRDAMSQRPSLTRAADRWAPPFLWAVLVLAAGCSRGMEPDRPQPRRVGGRVGADRHLPLRVVAGGAVGPAVGHQRAGPPRRAAAAAGCAGDTDQVQRVYFDKTGTVTDATLQYTGLQRLDGQPAGPADAASLARAAALAGWSQHPLSQALVAAAGDATAADPWRDVQEVPGQGLQALDAQGRCWRLGRAAFVQPGLVPAAVEGDGRAATWWGADGQASHRFDFDEALRPDALATVAALRQHGLQVVLLSGDQPARAARMGRRLGGGHGDRRRHAREQAGRGGRRPGPGPESGDGG